MAIDATLKGAIATVDRERTMLRASQLTLSVIDPDGELFQRIHNNAKELGIFSAAERAAQSVEGPPSSETLS